jgi:hypothetical protein
MCRSRNAVGPQVQIEEFVESKFANDVGSVRDGIGRPDSGALLVCWVGPSIGLFFSTVVALAVLSPRSCSSPNTRSQTKEAADHGTHETHEARRKRSQIMEPTKHTKAHESGAGCQRCWKREGSITHFLDAIRSRSYWMVSNPATMKSCC